MTTPTPIATHDYLLLGTLFTAVWAICLYMLATELYGTLRPWRVQWSVQRNCNWVAVIIYAAVGFMIATLGAFGIALGLKQLFGG